jgi:hypothetical protein
MKEDIPTYFTSIRFVTDCNNSLMVNGMNIDSFIVLKPIDLLSSVRTLQFEVMEMSEDFPHCFPNTIIFYC